MAGASGNYIEEKDVDNWPDAKDQSSRQSTIDYAEAVIERITKDIFHPVDFAIYLNGNDENRLNLGLIPNILSISAIKISGVTLDTSWYTYDKSSVLLDTESASSIAELNYLLKRTASQRLFPGGLNNIQVIGTMGWPEKLVIDTVVGTFQAGETITETGTGVTATVKEVRATYLLIGGRGSTNFTDDTVLTGGTSAATALVNAASGAINNPPEMVKEAVVIVARYRNDGTLYTPYIQGSESTGGMRRTTKKKPLTGLMEADLILRDYVRNKARMAVV